MRLPTFFAADLRAERRFALGAPRRVYLEIQNLTEPRERRGDHLQRRLHASSGYLTGLPLLAIAGVRIER